VNHGHHGRTRQFTRAEVYILPKNNLMADATSIPTVLPLYIVFAIIVLDMHAFVRVFRKFLRSDLMEYACMCNTHTQHVHNLLMLTVEMDECSSYPNTHLRRTRKFVVLTALCR